MSSKRESVAGCIRRLRNKLKAAGNGMVTIGYADLMVLLDAIETAHRQEVELLNRRLENVVNDRNATCGLCTSSDRIKKQEGDINELRASLERAINIICGKCYDKVRAKCARGEKKDCEVFALRKAFAEGEKK